MADNRLNLIVAFSGIDKLGPMFKNIIGLGKTSSQQLKELGKTVGEVNRSLKTNQFEIKKAMNDGAAGLTVLIEKQRAFEAQAKLANSALNRQKRMMAIDSRTARSRERGSKIAGNGMSTLLWGLPVATEIYEMAKTAGEAQSLENRLRVMGLDNRTISALETNARRAQVAGTSYIDMMRFTVEAQGAFRESGEHTIAEQTRGARIMAPILAKMSMASKALGMEMPEEQERYLLRFIEEAGGMSDPRKAAQISSGVFRALQSSGGNVQASDYQRFMAAAGTSGMKLSQRAMFADFEPLIGELHDAAGVGLMSSYLRLNGVGKPLAKPQAEMRRLGLWNARGTGMNEANTAMLAESPVDFYRNVVLASYAKGGVKDVQKENALIFGRTGGALFNQIDRALPAILRSRTAYSQTQGIDQAYNTAQDGFPGQMAKMKAAWQDFQTVAGSKGGALEMLTMGLRSATVALRGITDFGNAHPTAFKWIGSAAISLFALNMGIAALKIGFGNLLGPIAQICGWISKLELLGGLAGVFEGAGGALAILSGPVGWVIGAIALVAAGAYAIYRNWAGISGFFHKHWTAIRNLMLGAFVVLFPVLAALIVYIHKNWGAIAGFFKTAAMGIYNWLIHPFIQYYAFLGGAIAKFTWFGAQLVWGIIKGIGNATGALLLKIARLGIGLGATFAKAIDSHSPSRVFMAFGGHIADGLAIGVDRGAHRPIQSMHRLAAGMSTGFASASNSRRSSGGDTHHWHIIQSPGEDGRAFADRVMRVMESKTRGHRLSSYGDDF